MPDFSNDQYILFYSLDGSSKILPEIMTDLVSYIPVSYTHLIKYSSFDIIIFLPFPRDSALANTNELSCFIPHLLPFYI